MLKVADGRSVQRVVAQPPLLGKSLIKVNDSRQRYQAYDKLLIWNFAFAFKPDFIEIFFFSLHRRPQRKRRCEILDIPHDLPSLNLTPLRTTHIQQELWTYKKDKTFSMTPTEAINKLYYYDMDILHIDDWRFFTPKKRDKWYTPKTESIPQLLYMPPWILRDGPYPSLNQLD